MSLVLVFFAAILKKQKLLFSFTMNLKYNSKINGNTNFGIVS